MTDERQLGLPFPQAGDYAAASFIRGAANSAALAWIEEPAAWPANRLGVMGEAGVGKTHLLHVFAQTQHAAFLSGEALHVFMPLPDAQSLVIDDADRVGDPRALLHVMNAAGERKMPVLLSGRTAPSCWGTGLPDLDSRLKAMAVTTLYPPDDCLLRALLLRLLSESQFDISERIRDYLLRHVQRTGGALRHVVAELDRLALASGGHVTLAMAARAVGRSEPEWTQDTGSNLSVTRPVQ